MNPGLGPAWNPEPADSGDAGGSPGFYEVKCLMPGFEQEISFLKWFLIVIYPVI